MDILARMQEKFLAEGLEMDLLREEGLDMLATSFFYPGVPADGNGEPVSPVLAVTVTEDHGIPALAGWQILTLSAQVYYTEAEDNCFEVMKFAALVNPLLHLGSFAVNSYHPEEGWYLHYRFDVLLDPARPEEAMDAVGNGVLAFDYYMTELYERFIRIVAGQSTAAAESRQFREWEGGGG